MKNLKNLMLITISLIAISACKMNSDPAIEGTYVTAFENEYSRANDTLIVSVYNKDGDSYKIERRSGFNRIREGRILPREIKQEEWMATFSPETQVLTIANLGRSVYMNAAKGEAVMGNTVFKRVR
ncbi:hypothetical protein DJ568_02970 [Mucilaginibacter hurinus]|uniref:Uncharacterized protein n=1 Tax=Mucilaginibacter hurinus TaxID=2201324 RepID=A0A367GVY1_9SPHI|nr:hypothetical protein [Mucilaginibacter hurinus]RCH56833.1 hypothetical protein DJ568_02970 [Mucilaginibacter hurinus]